MDTDRYIAEGLTTHQINQLRQKYGYNELSNEKLKHPLASLLDLFKEPMIGLLAAAAIIYMTMGERMESAFMAFMVAFVVGIEFVQKRRTERALYALKSLSQLVTWVYRNGKRYEVNVRELVPGDLVELNEGDKIPADGKILEEHECEVNESMLTGESLPITKNATDKLFSGTSIVRGSALLKIESIGDTTEIGRIGSSLKSVVEQPTRMQAETKRITKIIAIAGISVCSLFVMIFGTISGEWLETLLQGIAIVMSLLPEEFPVVLTIFVALGAVRIAKKHVLTRTLPTIETLGSATVLCVDKTGTLTQNKLAIADIVPLTTTTEHNFVNTQANVLEIALLACTPNTHDPMEKVIQEAVKPPLTQPTYSLLKHYPLDSQMMAVGNCWQANDTVLVTVKGAPESIATLLSKQEALEMLMQSKQLASKGARVIAVAVDVLDSSAAIPSTLATVKAHLIGLLAFKDPVKTGVGTSIQQCKEAGIRVVMITGDHPLTAQSIGEEVGILSPDLVLTGDQIESLTLRELRKHLGAVNICARVKPYHKLKIVQALQKNGEIVAMTGDGVNDAPALKAANMGIAMGKHGTDVAREAADMVLTNDTFASIVDAIADGRRIYQNIRRAVGFILAVHIPIAMLTILPPFFGWPTLLTPIHIMLLELIIDPACTLVFEADKNDDNVMRNPPRSPKEPLFNLSLVRFSLIMGLFAGVIILGYHWSSGAVLSMTTYQLQSSVFSFVMVFNLILIIAMRLYGVSLSAKRMLYNPPFIVICMMIFSIVFLLPQVRMVEQSFHLVALPHSSYAALLGGTLSLLGLSFFTRRAIEITGD